MRALRFYAPGDVRLEDVPEPECGPKEVKIKVKNCSTCGTDVKIRNNGHVNITRVTTMGHEVAGEVVEVGTEALGGFAVGDRVQCIADMEPRHRAGRALEHPLPGIGKGDGRAVVTLLQSRGENTDDALVPVGLEQA